jgi:hypothetical protein
MSNIVFLCSVSAGGGIDAELGTIPFHLKLQNYDWTLIEFSEAP